MHPGDGTPFVAPLTGSICTVVGDTVNFVAEGTCELQASIAEGTNHLVATGPVQALEVEVNVPPVITSITGPDGPVALGTTVTVNATFTDGNVLDTHTATIDWGDGTVVAGTVVETDGSGIVLGSHTYASEGAYAVTVIDEDGDSDTQQLTSKAIIYIPLCVSTYNGAVTGTRSGGCGSGQIQVNAVGRTFCVEAYTSRVLYLSGQSCKTPNRQHVLPDNGDLLTCVSGYTGGHRWVSKHSMCTVHETRYTIRAYQEGSGGGRR